MLAGAVWCDTLDFAASTQERAARRRELRAGISAIVWASIVRSGRRVSGEGECDGLSLIWIEFGQFQTIRKLSLT